jgi:hypothetical protein
VDDRWLSDVRDVAGRNLYARADPSTVVVEVGGERQAVAEAAPRRWEPVHLPSFGGVHSMIPDHNSARQDQTWADLASGFLQPLMAMGGL